MLSKEALLQTPQPSNLVLLASFAARIVAYTR